MIVLLNELVIFSVLVLCGMVIFCDFLLNVMRVVFFVFMVRDVLKSVVWFVRVILFLCGVENGWFGNMFGLWFMRISVLLCSDGISFRELVRFCFRMWF